MRAWRTLRPLGFILGLWSALLTGEPQRLHTCPTQPVPSAGDSAPGAAPYAHAELPHHGAHAHAVGMVPDTESAPSGHHEGQASHECECLGTCACVANVSTPQGLLVHSSEPRAAADAGASFPETHDAVALERVQRRLPWPTAPPRVLLTS